MQGSIRSERPPDGQGPHYLRTSQAQCGRRTLGGSPRSRGVVEDQYGQTGQTGSIYPWGQGEGRPISTEMSQAARPTHQEAQVPGGQSGHTIDEEFGRGRTRPARGRDRGYHRPCADPLIQESATDSHPTRQVVDQMAAALGAHIEHGVVLVRPQSMVDAVPHPVLDLRHQRNQRQTELFGHHSAAEAHRNTGRGRSGADPALVGAWGGRVEFRQASRVRS